MRFEPDLVQGLGILQGWRQIARHIGKSVRTARRWYDSYSMPVRRNIAGRPFAFMSEIDRWMEIVDDLIKKNPEEKERQFRHAAYMRSCKKEKLT